MNLIRQCMSLEYLELSGIVKFPSQIATWLSPNGSVKKQSLYNKHPSAHTSAFVVIALPQ